jgi:surface polysaccharide O-acyltransferase-like enzyme
MRWFQWGPIAFQLNFIALYLVYFGAGVMLGASSLEGGIFHPGFARAWKKWLAAAVMFFVIWLLVSAKVFTTASASTGWMLADAIALVPACFAGCLCAILLAVHFGHVRTDLLQRLQGNAFGMYWVHYGVITWLQFALLAAALPAIFKALMVFMSAAILSWVMAALLGRLPVLNGILGINQRRKSPAVVPVHPVLL